MRARVLAAIPHTRQLPPATGRHRLTLVAERSGPRRLARAGLTTGILVLAAALVFLLVTTITTTTQLHRANSASAAIAAVLAAPDAHTESLTTSVGGKINSVVSLREHEAVVTTADLPKPSGTHVYQLWVINSAGVARSAGLLTLTSSGSSTPVLAAEVLKGDQIGITVEPAGGTAQPTTTPVVLMPVKA
jgi:anti-sigma-K factor RskA